MYGPRKPTYLTPTGNVTHVDDFGGTKQYVESDAQHTRTTTANSPFSLDYMKSLVKGRTTDAQVQKKPMTVQQQHASVEVVDQAGKRMRGHFFDVKYHMDGAPPVIAKSDGSVEKGEMAFMMAPGMQRGTGQFPEARIPKEQMTQHPSAFSYFTPIEDPTRK